MTSKKTSKKKAPRSLTIDPNVFVLAAAAFEKQFPPNGCCAAIELSLPVEADDLELKFFTHLFQKDGYQYVENGKRAGFVRAWYFENAETNEDQARPHRVFALLLAAEIARTGGL